MKLPGTINGHDVSVVVAFIDEGHTAEEAAATFGVAVSSMNTYVSTFKSLDMLGGGTGNFVPLLRGRCANPRCRRRIRWRIRLCFECDERRRLR